MMVVMMMMIVMILFMMKIEDKIKLVNQPLAALAPPILVKVYLKCLQHIVLEQREHHLEKSTVRMILIIIIINQPCPHMFRRLFPPERIFCQK